jgi:hypothetical protein
MMIFFLIIVFVLGRSELFTLPKKKTQESTMSGAEHHEQKMAERRLEKEVKMAFNKKQYL